jgi:hypothetical protein
MKFELETSARIYKAYEKEPLEKLGFKFKQQWNDQWLILKDVKVFIEIKTLKELIDFCGKYGKLVIFSSGIIEIYDSYRE